MISTLEKEITFRFLKARKKDGFLNVISIFSFIGISLGVAVLIIVMSVMNGFRSELINKIVGFNSHITVKPYETPIDKNLINKDLQKISKDLIFSNSGEAIIIKSEISKGIVMRGYKNNDSSWKDVNTFLFNPAANLGYKYYLPFFDNKFFIEAMLGIGYNYTDPKDGDVKFLGLDDDDDDESTPEIVEDNGIAEFVPDLGINIGFSF